MEGLTGSAEGGWPPKMRHRQVTVANSPLGKPDPCRWHGLRARLHKDTRPVLVAARDEPCTESKKGSTRHGLAKAVRRERCQLTATRGHEKNSVPPHASQRIPTPNNASQRQPALTNANAQRTGLVVHDAGDRVAAATECVRRRYLSTSSRRGKAEPTSANEHEPTAKPSRHPTNANGNQTPTKRQRQRQPLRLTPRSSREARCRC